MFKACSELYSMGKLGFRTPFSFALVPNLESSKFSSFDKNHLKKKCNNAVIKMQSTRTLGKEQSRKETT